MAGVNNIVQVGQKLAKTFKTSRYSRDLVHVISETIDGKTYTRVIDETGKVLKQRVKSIERTQIGDKLITTISKDIQVDKNNPQNIGKTILDLIYKVERSEYNSDIIFHFYKGARKTILNPSGSKIVQKETNFHDSHKGYTKFFDTYGKVFRKEAYEAEFKNSSGSALGNIFDKNIIATYFNRKPIKQMELIGKVEPVYYNNKGLPIPTDLNSQADKYANSTLQEMIHVADKQSYTGKCTPFPVGQGMKRIESYNTFDLTEYCKNLEWNI